ncbi:MAG: peptidoglycan bridge formation glycyltransferase FemA/FemB family protein [Chloroflexi bacterium]|nr:peptidoglycan bridge formation glycyltransferase FemA/FemB family protein [Chloroflexota bacterium]
MNEVDWNSLLLSFPAAHLLQSAQWAEIKKENGWNSDPVCWKDEAGNTSGVANILTRCIKPLGLGPGISVCYVPRGPIWDWSDRRNTGKVLDQIQEYAKKKGAMFIKIDPEVILGRGIPGTASALEEDAGTDFLEELRNRGWCYSPEQVQFKNTVLLDLEGSEEEWLSSMKQKARYNLRLAQRSGLVVRVAKKEELPVLYKMYAETAARDHFIIREIGYYLRVWDRFMDAEMALPLIAEFEEKPVAGLVLFHFGSRAWYLYGMSTDLFREKMPNYLLQWEAMRRAKSYGCSVYDLWGAPEKFDSTDHLFGVYRFKEGLGGQVIRTPGAWDYPIKPLLYFAYQRLLPRILGITRRIRQKKILQEIR